MKSRSPTFTNLPLDIVGSTAFGRYPKISVEQTYNMIISDNFLVPYAGYKYAITDANGNPLPLSAIGAGRGIFHSTILNQLIVVIYNNVFVVNSSLVATQIGTLNTFAGDVFIDENNANQIAICDKTAIWIYNTTTNLFTKASIAAPFLPGYVAFQDGYFITVDLNSAQWALSALNDGTTWSLSANTVGGFQSKPDKPVAVLRFPGRGNLLFVIGSVVTELWYDVGAALFPYQRNSGVNIDYGTLNADTVASLDNIVCWLGANERSGPVILASTGGTPERLSNDGIDFRLNALTNPSDAHGFMFRQDGHIFYQLTFPTDNFSITYDFNTGKFFTVTDPNLNYHIAKRVAYFNNTYYFVSLNDGNLYEMSTNDTTYAGKVIPRIRICKTVRMPDTAPFVTNNLSFPLEQGVDNVPTNSVIAAVVQNGGSGYTAATVIFEGGGGFGATGTVTVSGGQVTGITITNGGEGYIAAPVPSISGDGTGAYGLSYIDNVAPIVDLAISNDGGYVFSNYDQMTLNSLGVRKNRFIYYNLGWSNEFTPQFRMFSLGRFVAGDGTVSIYQ
jgi:hypothetical protein